MSPEYTGVRKHHPLYPLGLIDKYDVSSDDDALFASMLTSEIIGYFMKYEGVWVEVNGGDLMVHQPITNAPKNYKAAIENAHSLAHLLRIKPLNNPVDTNNSKSNNGVDSDVANTAAPATP